MVTELFIHEISREVAELGVEVDGCEDGDGSHEQVEVDPDGRDEGQVVQQRRLHEPVPPLQDHRTQTDQEVPQLAQTHLCCAGISPLQRGPRSTERL